VGALVLASAAVATAADSRAVEVARSYVERQAPALGLAVTDVGDTVVQSVSESRKSGVTHVYLQQRYRGIEVYNGILNVSVDRTGRVLHAGESAVRGLAARAAAARLRGEPIAAVDAAAAAARELGLRPTAPFEVLERKGGADDATTLSDGGIAIRAIDARLTWYEVDAALHLAWRLEIEEAGGEHWWYALIDATSGALLGKDDLIVHDSAEAIAAAVARPEGGPSMMLAFDPTDGATYNVFPLPMESPSDGDRSLVTDVANPAASPFGWHDTDGNAGPEFTRTRGNNVHAYADRDNNNIPDPLSDPDGGLGLVFDFPLDLTLRPLDSQPAMVTNLFFWNNIMHDVTYNYGFDEVSGNFQVNLYGNGGVGNDDVRAEAQDGSGRNNANFGTGVDGVRPRMQMFEWRSSAPNPITVHPPSAIAGTYYGPMAGFGESLVTTGPISGTVELVNDGVIGVPVPPAPPGTLNDGCEPFVVTPGAIPLMDRGFCTFVIKVKNAQNAGASVAIVGNNVAGPPIGMGGADPTIVIPSVMISLDDANLWKANLPFDATVADGTGGAPDRDSDIDNGVIAHEYGHGISNRLTGGPTIVTCLNNAEQMGEGWSDWFALTLTTLPSDTLSTARGIGTYVSFQPADGLGIRPTPYSTDMAVNPSTYADVADVVNISQPHGIGYIWNTMLWEVYWNLVDRYGYNADIYADWSTAGNNLAFQLVIDGMKLQPCRPGFEDGRDAILAADVALTGGANRCEIWRGFAKRGMGFSADQVLSSSRTDGIEAFDLPPSCTVAVFGGFQQPLDPEPAVQEFDAGQEVPIKFSVSGVPSVLIDSQEVDCTTLEPTGAAPEAIASPAFPVRGTRYHVDWLTDPDWAGTCRRITLRIPAASDAHAFVSFD
jgi:hypothetical protein